VYGKAKTLHLNQIQQPSLPLWPLFRETTDSALGCFDFECTKICFLINWNLKDFVTSVLFFWRIFASFRQRNWNFFLSCWNSTSFASFRKNFDIKKNEKENSVYNLFHFIIMYVKES
jgi:hypothetical protein